LLLAIGAQMRHLWRCGPVFTQIVKYLLSITVMRTYDIY